LHQSILLAFHQKKEVQHSFCCRRYTYFPNHQPLERIKGRKSTKRPTYTVDRKFVGELEKEGLQQQLSSKRCKVFDGKDQKRAEVH
jgi:hypothetical protein